jgi:uncharacterized protein YbjT (DUF2867 family)
MSAPILVTGGTGTLGTLVVQRLRDLGHEVRVLSRSEHEAADRADGVTFVVGDLMTGDGVDAAVDGVDTVLHLAGTMHGDGEKAERLVRAAGASGVKHVVYVSVVGADRMPIVSRVDRAMFGYFDSKLAGERAIAESGIAWTILRATQFHELVVMMVGGMSKLPVVPVPSVRVQPVAADEVAARLVELALSAPAGLVDDIAGPDVYTLKQLVRSYLGAVGRHRLTAPIRLPGKAARAYREGANLSPDHAVGKRTWPDFLREHVSAGGTWPC